MLPVLGVLLALLIMLLAVPLSIVFTIHHDKLTQGLIRFGWLFGLVHFQLRLPVEDSDKTESDTPSNVCKKAKARKTRRRDKKRNMQGMFDLVRHPVFRQRVLQFIRDMLAASHAEDLFLHLRIGTGDPADTGRLWAMVGPLAGLVRNIKSIDARIEPEFMQSLFEVETRGRFRIVPIQLIYLVIRLLLSLLILAAGYRLQMKGA